MLRTVKCINSKKTVFTLIDAGLPVLEYSVITDNQDRLIVVDNKTNTFIGQVIAKDWDKMYANPFLYLNAIVLKHPPWRAFLPTKRVNL